MVLPLVSIILPVWNPCPEWVNEAIDSAFNESGCRIELVLVDDGSDEPSDNWLLPRNAERIRIIRSLHHGVSYARNLGIKKCQGDFFRFLDADDLIFPESTSTLLNLIGEEHNVLAYGSTIVCNQHLIPHSTFKSKLSGNIHLKTVLGRFTIMFQAMLIPHKIVVKVGGFDERFVVQGDWDFVLRCSEIAEIRGTLQPVYLYRHHENSLTGSGVNNREAIRSSALIIKNYLNRHPEIKGTREERLVRAYAQFLIAKFQSPEYPLRNPRFWKAASVDPVRGVVIAYTRTTALIVRKAKFIAHSLIHSVDK
jgi:glycosyltransferase involved in cell wall biosynthesis